MTPRQAAERQREQDKEARETSRPEREAAERARRAWHIESNPDFEALPVRKRRLIVDLWDKVLPRCLLNFASSDGST